jgi:flagellar hook-basal body complex protein FliE
LFRSSFGINIAQHTVCVKKEINIMNLNTSALFNDLPLQGLQSNGLGNELTDQVAKTNAPDFSEMLKQAIDNVNGLQQNTSDLRNRFEMGDQDVSLGDVMIASNKSSLAFDATIQVRNKMVEAYKEVMSMPV